MTRLEMRRRARFQARLSVGLCFAAMFCAGMSLTTEHYVLFGLNVFVIVSNAFLARSNYRIAERLRIYP